jgi:hypothetical protein
VPVTWAGSSSGCPGSSRRLDDTLLWRNTAVVGVVALWCRQCRDRPGVTRGYSTDVPHCTLPAAGNTHGNDSSNHQFLHCRM